MTGMDCETVSDLLPERARGSLDPELSARVDAHLRGCDACAEDFAVVRLLKESLAGVPPGLEARIGAALADEAGAAATRRRGFRVPRPAWAAAAVLVLALGTSLWVRPAAAPATDEEVWTAFFAGVRPIWVAEDGVVAGAPLLEELSDLSEEQLAILLEDLGR